MKTKYIYSAALVLALAGCSEDELAELNSGIASNETVKVSASVGADTRLAVSDAGSQLAFAWEDTDKITIYNGTQATDFVIDSESAGSSFATFSGTPRVPFHQGETLFGVYNRRQNAANSGLDENGNLVIDLGDQTGELNDEYQYMFAQSTFDGNTTFSFKHLVSILKVNVTLPEGVSSLDKLTLFSEDYIVSKATVVMNTPVQGPWNYYNAGEIVADFSDEENKPTINSISVDHFEVNGNVATAYIYVLPAMTYSVGNSNWHHSAWMSPSFVAQANGENYVSINSFKSRDLQPGKMYEINTELKPTISLSLGENDAVADQDYYFTPEKDGFYRFAFSGSYNHNFGQYLNGYYYLSAGNTYRLYIYNLHTSTINVSYAPCTEIELNTTLTGESYVTMFYSFTPSEAGYYGMSGNGKCSWSYDINNNGVAYLEAGKTYYGTYYFYNNDENYASLVKAVELQVAEGSTSLNEGVYVLSFTPQISDYYQVQLENGTVAWYDLGYGAQELEAGITYKITVVVNGPNGSTINLSSTKAIENMEVNVAYSPEEYGKLAFIPEISYNGDRSTTWYYIDGYNCGWGSGSSMNYSSDYTINGCEHFTEVNEWSKRSISDFRIYGENSYFVLRRYEEETAELTLDTEYTIEPGHVVVYQFAAPEDGIYSIRYSQGEWNYWSDWSTNRYFSAGDTDVIYVCVPEKSYDNTTIFTVSKVEE